MELGSIWIPLLLMRFGFLLYFYSFFVYLPFWNVWWYFLTNFFCCIACFYFYWFGRVLYIFSIKFLVDYLCCKYSHFRAWLFLFLVVSFDKQNFLYEIEFNKLVVYGFGFCLRNTSQWQGHNNILLYFLLIKCLIKTLPFSFTYLIKFLCLMWGRDQFNILFIHNCPCLLICLPFFTIYNWSAFLQCSTVPLLSYTKFPCS